MKEDRYFETEQIAYQLVRNYWKHGNVIVAFDFDDTIYDWHDKGDIFPLMERLLQDISKDPDKFKLMLFTAREGKALEEAYEYCRKKQVFPMWINDNPMMHTRKPFYNILFDDKAGLGQAYEAFMLFLKIIRYKDE